MNIIKRAEQQRTETRERMRGGEGAIDFRYLVEKEEFSAPVRLCSRLTIPPGASIGMHAHEQEDEVYIILSGSGAIHDGTTETVLNAGDTALTGKGGAHSIRNIGTAPLDMIAIIVTY